MTRKSFLLYTEYASHISMLSDDECGKLFRAILMYADTGITTELTGCAAMAFGFIKSDLDRNMRKYDEIVERRREAGRAGGKKSAEIKKKSTCGKPVEKDVENIVDKNTGSEASACFDMSDKNVCEANQANALKIASKSSKCFEIGKQIQHDNDNVNVNDNDNVNDNVNVNVNVNDNDNECMPDGGHSADGGGSEKEKDFVDCGKRDDVNQAIPSQSDVRYYCSKSGLRVDPDRFWNYHNERDWVIGGSPVRDWRALLLKWDEKEKQRADGSDQSSDIVSALKKKYGAETNVRGDDRSYDIDEFVNLAMNHKFDE